MNKKSNFRGRSGFSLVELIVVVAIIGILASIVVPNYNKISFRVRKSEAMTQLSGLYTAERSFYAEYGAYHSSFSAIGYSPEGDLRFNVGFGATTPANEARAANGYNTPLSVAQLAAINTMNYCSIPSTAAPGMAGNSCRLLLGFTGNMPPALNAGFAIMTDNFIAGATISVPQELVGYFDGNEIFNEDSIAYANSRHLRRGGLVTLRPLLFQSAQASVGGSRDVVLAINASKMIVENSCDQNPLLISTGDQGTQAAEQPSYEILTASELAWRATRDARGLTGISYSSSGEIEPPIISCLGPGGAQTQ